MIWLVMAILTGLALVLVLWPFWCAAPVVRERADIAFYQAQIAEIDADMRRGLVDPADAETARALAARRLLALDQLETPPASGSTSARRLAIALTILTIPAVALGLYAHIGRPDLSDQPLAGRVLPLPAPAQVKAAPPTEKAAVETELGRIEKHLAAHPDDGGDFELLAPMYQALGRFDEAVHAREEALRLLGPTAQRHAALADAMIAAREGMVTIEANDHLELALALDPKLAQARYYSALGSAQDGDFDRARKIWTALDAETPVGAPLKRALQQKLAALEESEAQPATGAAGAIAALPAEAQQKAIRDMVEQLAQRLSQHGGDAESWMRLIRAYKVLDEPEKARAALKEARKALKRDPAALKALSALARELGLDG
jgi:cytochrome c-type biogenesis protein CcmH